MPFGYIFSKKYAIIYEIATTSIKPLSKNDRNITAKQGLKSGIKPHMYAIANSDGQIEYINICNEFYDKYRSKM